MATAPSPCSISLLTLTCKWLFQGDRTKWSHLKTQKEPNQVICSSYPALCDKGYQFLVVLSQVLVLRSYVLAGYNIIHWNAGYNIIHWNAGYNLMHWNAHKICSAHLIFWDKHLDTSALVISHLYRVEDYGLLQEEDTFHHHKTMLLTKIPTMLLLFWWPLKKLANHHHNHYHHHLCRYPQPFHHYKNMLLTNLPSLLLLLRWTLTRRLKPTRKT